MTTSHEDDVYAEMRAGAERAKASRENAAATGSAAVPQHSGGTGRKVLSQFAWIAGLGISRNVWHATGGAWGVVAVIAVILAGFILAGKLWPSAE